MDYSWKWAMALALTVAAACGPSAGDDDTNGGSDTDDTTTGTDTVTATSVGDTTGEPVSCEDYLNEDATVAGTIEIRNVGTDTLLLNSPCFGFEYVELTTPSGLQWPGGFCEQSCQAAFTEGCIVCGGCAIASYTVLDPGASISLDWDGRMLERRTPDAACFEETMCAPSCPQARADYDEPITVTVEAITQQECLEVDEDAQACRCEEGAESPCNAGGSAGIDPTVQTTFEVAPGTTEIVVEIGG